MIDKSKRNRRFLQIGAGLAGVAVFGFVFAVWGYPFFFEKYTGVVNAPLTYDIGDPLSDEQFETLAADITRAARRAEAMAATAGEKNTFARRIKMDMFMATRSRMRGAEFRHVDIFRKAGIRQYVGPKTCLGCHEKMKVAAADGTVHEVDTLEDVADTVHFKFQTTAAGFSTYGYDGRQVNAEGDRQIPVGKINRACGIPGSFSWTGWASKVVAKPGHAPETEEIRSEGCGQCHIGGNYHPATKKMMPVGDVPDEAKEGIDCLICHSPLYDMNYRYVIEDEYGMRWNQDRTLRAAMAVGPPTSATCLTCHQHNLGGDTETNTPPNAANKNLGYEAKRLLHPGAKRGSSFTPEKDVHAAAGVQCTDCHVPEGHKIPRGTQGVDLVSNDLPGKTVACENCHTDVPHLKGADRVILNGHVARLACETCHITELHHQNVVLRDWIHPVWNEEEGVYVFTDVYQSGKVNEGFIFLWFNGNGTFLANALGDNPLGTGSYNPLINQMVKITNPDVVAAIRANAEKLTQQYPDLDVDHYVKVATDPLSQLTPEMLEKRKAMIEKNLRPVMKKGTSKLAPFKIFNAIMYEDMANQGPFGAMILPFDYPTYYETGDTLNAMKTAIANPIVKRMYERPFKAYMMDEFMSYFGVDEWTMDYPLQKDGSLRNIETHWMRQMGTLMVNHGITREGRECKECHAKAGIIDFENLGYPPERVADLRDLPEIRQRNDKK